MIRIAVVDDDTLMRAAFLGGINSQVRTVVAVPEVTQLPDDLVDLCDVLVLDLRLRSASRPDERTVQGTGAVVVAARLGVPILIYTNEQRLDVLAACTAVGARGLVFKADPIEELVEGLLQVAAGATFVTPAAAGLLSRLESLRASGLILTNRQIDVLRLRASGFPNARIAERLHLVPKTVDRHVENLGRAYKDYLRSRGEAQLLHDLGLADGDLVDPEHLRRKRRRRPH